MPSRWGSSRADRRGFLARATLAGAAAVALSGPRGAQAATEADAPVRVRFQDVVFEGRGFRGGEAAGVRLPGQGGGGSLRPERSGASYVSPPVRAPFPATHLGVHWRLDLVGRGSAGGRPGVEIRTSRDSQGWSGWRRVQVDAHGKDEREQGTEAVFGALIGVRGAGWLQYRVTFGADAARSAGLERMTLTVLDAGTTPRRSAGAGWVAARGRAALLDRVVTREQWGADESIRFSGDEDLWPRAFVAPKLMVVHHTATENEYADPAAEVRAIYAFHTVTRGFGDIGYHALVDNRGQIYEGRLGRTGPGGAREVLSQDVVGGHALRYNFGSAGFAVLGNFMDRQPSTAAVDSLVDLLAFEAERSLIDPSFALDFLRGLASGERGALWHDGLEAVSGHRDVTPTECPGDRLYALLPELRERVLARFGRHVPAPQMVAAPADRNARPGALGFGWSPPAGAAQFSTRLEGWRHSDLADRIVPLAGYGPEETARWEPWSDATTAEVEVPAEAAGLYTLHVRARDARGAELPFAARTSVWVDRHDVRDNLDGGLDRGGVARTGAWTPRRDVLGYNGADFEQAEPGGVKSSFSWTLTAPESGRYRLQACWTDGEARASNARFAAAVAGERVLSGTVDQHENGGRWNLLGELSLAAGQTVTVTLDNVADGPVVADAVRIVRAG
ncbi:MAG: N-acetylmuramoyl-L-alanine amidase [Chloroflexota bacterium]